MLRFERSLLGVGSVLWLAAGLASSGLLPLAGLLELGLYGFYSLSSALGWVAGNAYVFRQQRLFGVDRGPSRPGPFRPETARVSPPPEKPTVGRSDRRRFLFVYLLSPPGLLYLVRSMAPEADQAAAPFVPLYALCVYGLFFLVPVTLKVGRT